MSIFVILHRRDVAENDSQRALKKNKENEREKGERNYEVSRTMSRRKVNAKTWAPIIVQRRSSMIPD